MDLVIGTKDPVNKILWDEYPAQRAAGGFSLADTLPSTATYLLKGAVINYNETSRVANVVKTAAIAAGTVSAPQIAIGHTFKVGDYMSDGVVALEIASITSGATNDTFAFTSGQLSTAVVGTVVYEAGAAQLTAGGAGAVATVQDTVGDYLIATADVSKTGANWNNVSLVIEQAGDDVLAVAFAAGILTISLAATTPGNNNLSAINAIVTALGTVEGYDLTELTFTGIDWDDKQTGATLTTPLDLFDGGVNQIAPALNFTPNALLSDNTKNVGTPTITAIIAALEIQEANLPFPVTDDIKTALGARFQFV